MVKFVANRSFDYSTFSLYGMFAHIRDTKQVTNLEVGGSTYPKSFVYNNPGANDFAVSGKVTLNVNLVGQVFGTAYAFSYGSYYESAGHKDFVENWVISGLSIDASRLSSAATTVGTTDDANLFKLIFSGNDTVILSSGNDFFCGFAGNDLINGGNGNDFLAGDTGNDRLSGDMGADMLYGGSGRDVFVFSHQLQSTVASSGRDTILDFQRGADLIDLSGIDANTRLSGDQKFVLSTATGKHANAVWAVQSGTSTIVYGDTNGDAKADFSILVQGITKLAITDFIL